MIEIGKYNELAIIRLIEHGLILCDDEEKEVLLPQAYVTNDMTAGDDLEVFIYVDSEDRIIATTETPKVTLHHFAMLEVVDVNRFGAFLDWGLRKDLLVPFREQTVDMETGKRYIVFLYLDEDTDRLVGSAKIRNILDNDEMELELNDEVEAMIYAKTDLGYKVIINHLHDGLIYQSEVFQPLEIGQSVKAYIKNIREDNKLDISLQRQGYSAVSPIAEKILEMLRLEEGFLPVTDKSRPDEIRERFQISKKVFKKALGDLYKKRMIKIETTGIFLIDSKDELEK